MVQTVKIVTNRRCKYLRSIPAPKENICPCWDLLDKRGVVNKSGPTTVPWGTSDVSGPQKEDWPSMTTSWEHWVQKFSVSVHVSRGPLIPYGVYKVQLELEKWVDPVPCIVPHCAFSATTLQCTYQQWKLDKVSLVTLENDLYLNF